jgi:tripartite-type tricarboxylate transporter receptor subunit TctC
MKRLVATLAISAALMSTAVHAQTFPIKPVRFVVAFPPGGRGDISARMFAPELSAGLGQPIVVENRPGAGTNIANEYVAKAVPDGYTLLVNSAAVVINMSLYKNVGYDAMRDLAPVSSLTQSPNILAVHPSLPVKTVKDLIALAKVKPGAMNFSSGGSGTTQHLTGELFKLRTGTNIVHVPFKGSAPSLVALLGGHVEMTFANLPAISSYVKTQRLRALANTAGTRAAQLPDVPTLKEAGVNGIDVVVWFGVLAPGGTPRDIISILATAIGKAARSPNVRQRLMQEGAEPVGNSPEEFGQLLKQESARWSEVIRVSGAKVD